MKSCSGGRADHSKPYKQNRHPKTTGISRFCTCTFVRVILQFFLQAIYVFVFFLSKMLSVFLKRDLTWFKVLCVWPCLILPHYRVGLQGKQSQQRRPDFPGPSQFLELIQWDPKLFPGQPRDTVPPAPCFATVAKAGYKVKPQCGRSNKNSHSLEGSNDNKSPHYNNKTCQKILQISLKIH